MEETTLNLIDSYASSSTITIINKIIIIKERIISTITITKNNASSQVIHHNHKNSHNCYKKLITRLINKAKTLT